jgi:hypothetical protein
MFREYPDILALIDHAVDQIGDHLLQVASVQPFLVLQEPLQQVQFQVRGVAGKVAEESVDYVFWCEDLAEFVKRF